MVSRAGVSGAKAPPIPTGTASWATKGLVSPALGHGGPARPSPVGSHLSPSALGLSSLSRLPGPGQARSLDMSHWT